MDKHYFFILVDVEHSHVRFLGNLVLNIWDCGGQEAFMENYFASQREVNNQKKNLLKKS